MKSGGIFNSLDTLGLGGESDWTTPAKLDEPLVPPTDEKTPLVPEPVKVACPDGEIWDGVLQKCKPISVSTASASVKTNAMTLGQAAPWLIGAAVLGFVLVYKLK